MDVYSSDRFWMNRHSTATATETTLARVSQSRQKDIADSPKPNTHIYFAAAINAVFKPSVAAPIMAGVIPGIDVTAGIS